MREFQSERENSNSDCFLKTVIMVEEGYKDYYDLNYSSECYVVE